MIRSTFYGFSTALSGLRASQTALDVIGQNVSNANTEGYTRQRVNQDSVVNSTTAERYGSTTGPLTGQGVSVNSLSQIRDTTLDARFRTESASVGRYDAELGAMSDIEAVFDEATTSAMRDSILAVQTAFQNLSLNTGNDEFDALTRASASNMTKLMNQYAQQLEDAYDQEVYDFEYGSVADVNNLLKNISIMDKTILKSEVAGDNPLELYDQRNTMLDELSSYGDLSYYYEKVTLAANITTNVLHVSMKTADGQSVELINGNKFAQFGVETDEGYDKYTIADNTVTLKVSGLTDDTTDTYTDIVKKMAVGNPPKEPTDVTPVYGNEAVLDADGNETENYKSKYNPNALTNGILYGTLNMLNASGDYEIGGSTVRGYKYYVKALDTLASTMATQMNEQNRSVRFTTSGETLYNISYLNETTGVRSGMTYGDDGREIAAREVTVKDDNGDPVLNADGNPETKIEYGYITLSDNGNYEFELIEDTQAASIAAGMTAKSNRMFMSSFVSDAGNTRVAQSDKDIFNVTDSNGNAVTTSDGKAVFQFTDNNGNDVLGTIADDGETITALTDEEQIYVDAKTGKKKYAQIDASTSTFTNTTTVPVDGKYELQAVYLDNTDPQEQATDADGNLIYAIETKDATNGNTAYIYGTIAPIETTNGGDESPFYKFTQVTNNNYIDATQAAAATGAAAGATTTAATLVKVESEINDDAYSANDDPLIYNVKDSDGNAVKTYEGDTVYAIYQNDGQGNLTKILGTVVQNANDPFSFEFTELSEEDQMYVEAASGYKKYTTNGEELVSVNIKDANGDAGEQATYQGKKVYAVQTGTDAAGAATYKYGYIDNVDSEPYYNFTELPEAYQDSYAVDTAVAGDPNIKMRSVTTKDSDVFTYDEIGGEYRQKNDFDVNNLNQYWDENLFSAEDGVSTVGVTAKYIAVSDAWMQSSTDVTNTRSFSSTGDDKSGDNSNILKMIQLFDNSTSFNTGKSNITLFTGGYEAFLSTVGDTVALDVNTSTTRLDSYDNVLTSIDSDRMSVSGVNIDEEAVDIYQYQRAYEAASRVMTALDELLDKLINSTGTVGR